MQTNKLQAQIEHERIMTKLRTTDAATKACGDELKATGINTKLYEEILYESDTSANKYKLLTKDEKPTKEQIEYLKDAIPTIIKCRVHVSSGYVGTPFLTPSLNYFNAQDAVYIKLMKSEVTISQANEERLRSIAQYKNEWTAASNEMDTRLRAMHNAEVEGRRQAAAAMMPFLMQQQQNQQFQQQMLYQQQMQNIINNRPILTSPTTTNCTTFGSQTNCTTR
jgi:hypothetical protein